jgi:hypothetical protein
VGPKSNGVEDEEEPGRKRKDLTQRAQRVEHRVGHRVHGEEEPKSTVAEPARGAPFGGPSEARGERERENPRAQAGVPVLRDGAGEATAA